MNKTGEIRCINGTGDTRTAWDKADPESLAKAESEFNRLLTKERQLAAVKNEDGTHTMIKAFDPEAKEIKMFRPLIGGQGTQLLPGPFEMRGMHLYASYGRV